MTEAMPAAAEPVAVVDLGTNSTRLLVATVDANGTVHELVRRSEVTRLGDGVDATGRLNEDAIQRVMDRLAEFRDEANAHGAQAIGGVATSAVRDAANGDEFRDRVRSELGIDLRVITGDEEATLTFLGATAGRPPAPTLVVDIGGGSTEYVIGSPGQPPSFHVSTQLGSVRQSERHLAHDPPEHSETEALGRAARDTIAASVPEAERGRVERGLAVAGTATSLAAIDQHLEPYDPTKVDGYRLNLGSCERMLAMLAGMPLDERREVPGLHPDRAATIVAGAAILVESIRTFDLPEIEVTESDILHGMALRAATQTPL